MSESSMSDFQFGEPAAGPVATSSLGPDFPWLASRAAIELDGILIGRANPSVESIRQLAQRLGNSTNLNAGSERSFVADLPTLDIFTRALTASRTSVSTVNDAAREAWRISEELHRTPDRSQLEASQEARRQIEMLRTFCIELARNSVVYRQLIDEPDASQSFWS